MPETSVKNLSKVFPLCFLQIVSETFTIFIRTKNNVNMQMPIDSFIINIKYVTVKQMDGQTRIQMAL